MYFIIQELSSRLDNCPFTKVVLKFVPSFMQKAIAYCILLQNNVHITKSFTSLLHCTYFEYSTCTSPIMHLICPPPPPQQKKLHNLCFSFPLGITALPREIRNNAYATFFFWGGGGGGWGGNKVHCGRCASGVSLWKMNCSSFSGEKQ